MPRQSGASRARADKLKRPRRKPAQSRDERNESTRKALIEAAAKVIGEVGYAEASIARITERAKVAQGTFYNYFTSRQDMFDQLLPTVGKAMLDYIRGRVDKSATEAEREGQRLRAYFDFLEKNPEFYRILYEAETLAPLAHQTHMKIVADGYVRALRRSWDRGDMPAFEKRELEPIAYMLLAIRGYLSMRYGAGSSGKAVPDWIVRTYQKLISRGLFS